MALPNFRQQVVGGPSGPMSGAQTMTAGTPVSFNILKERLRSQPAAGASPIGPGPKVDELRHREDITKCSLAQFSTYIFSFGPFEQLLGDISSILLKYPNFKCIFFLIILMDKTNHFFTW